jgi:hypothetical protein
MFLEEYPSIDAQSVARQIAAELREHPERWTQRTYARDSAGAEVAHDHAKAVCWCLHGLIKRALKLSDGEAVREEIVSAFELAAVGKPFDPRAVDGLTFPSWQDQAERTVADIIAVCDQVAVS